MGLRWNHGTPDFTNTYTTRGGKYETRPGWKIYAGYAAGGIFVTAYALQRDVVYVC